MYVYRFTLPGLALPGLALAAALTLTVPAHAQGTGAGPTQSPTSITQSAYNVTVFTSSLAADTYTLDFQFFDGTFSGGGATSADGNNSVKLSALNLGGYAAGNQTLSGGATAGSGAYTLTDSASSTPSAEFEQQFIVSSSGNSSGSITFTISLPTHAADTAQTADELAFSVLNSMGSEALPTNDPAGASGVLLTFDYPTTTDKRFTYTNFSPNYVQLAPEPSQAAALGLGILGLGGLVLQARKRRLPASLPH